MPLDAFRNLLPSRGDYVFPTSLLLVSDMADPSCMVLAVVVGLIVGMGARDTAVKLYMKLMRLDSADGKDSGSVKLPGAKRPRKKPKVAVRKRRPREPP